MLKSDDLREFRPVYKYQDGSSVTLKAIQTALTEQANTVGLPIAFYDDQVKSGGLFNKLIEDCIVLYHPEHKNDYFKFAIRVQRQGNLAFVYVNDFGKSSQMAKAQIAESYKNDRQGQRMSYKVGSLVGQALTTIGRSKTKLEAEQNYYYALEEILDQVIS